MISFISEISKLIQHLFVVKGTHEAFQSIKWISGLVICISCEMRIFTCAWKVIFSSKQKESIADTNPHFLEWTCIEMIDTSFDSMLIPLESI